MSISILFCNNDIFTNSLIVYNKSWEFATIFSQYLMYKTGLSVHTIDIHQIKLILILPFLVGFDASTVSEPIFLIPRRLRFPDRMHCSILAFLSQILYTILKSFTINATP